MTDLLRLVLHADGTPNLVVIVPALAGIMVLGGVVVALVRARLGPPEPVSVSEWAHAAYSIWTGGEDCGEWDRARAQDALRSWYAVQDPRGFWGVVEGLRRGQTSSLAWDQVRALDLLRIGTAAGYVAPAECWSETGAIAASLRERFDSWAAVARDFEAGMHAWQDQRGVTDPQQRGRVQRNLPYLQGTAWKQAAFLAPLE
ncbi:MAG: DUF1266 domain-containing protein [Myxococcales bacterium]|nr:DUF1266 domain-containing protein [Myxococcales bacterium]